MANHRSPSAVAVAVLACSLAAFGGTANGDEEFALYPADGAQGDWFGDAVDVEGEFAIIGAPLNDATRREAGSAYVFAVNSGKQSIRLLPLDPRVEGLFGTAVAIRGTLAVVGAPNSKFDETRSGAVYLFDITEGEQLVKLGPSLPRRGQWFGSAVALSRSYVLIGSREDSEAESGAGSAYLFDLSTGNQIFKFLPESPDVNEFFGAAVALHDNIAAIGAPQDRGNGAASGAVYLFEIKTGQPLATIIPSDNAEGDRFGTSLSVSGSILVVGAPGDDDRGSSSGSAYLFDIRSFNQIAKILPLPQSAGDYFGSGVAIEDGRVVVGAMFDDPVGSGSGSAYLFDIDGSRAGRLFPSEGVEGGRFGGAVAISGNVACVGARGQEFNGVQTGAALLFDPYLSVTSIDRHRTRYDRSIEVELSGYGFRGKAPPTVLFDGVLATNIEVLSDQSIRCRTPIGDPGRPEVCVVVRNSNGEDCLKEFFSFTPALWIEDQAAPGEEVTLSYWLDPQDSIYAIYGPDLIPPTFLPPYDGTLCIQPWRRLFLSIGWFFDTWTQTFTVPDDPTLSGLEIRFQGLVGPSLGRPHDAAWTNCATLRIR